MSRNNYEKKSTNFVCTKQHIEAMPLPSSPFHSFNNFSPHASYNLVSPLCCVISMVEFDRHWRWGNNLLNTQATNKEVRAIDLNREKEPKQCRRRPEPSKTALW
jgi:hypothetical protein